MLTPWSTSGPNSRTGLAVSNTEIRHNIRWYVYPGLLTLLTAVPLAFILVAALTQPIYAQTLNEQVINLTDNMCADLGSPSASQLGPNLGSICGTPTGTGGISGGGGAASSQGAETSARTSVFLKRLEESRGKEEDPTTKQTSYRLGNGVNLSLSGLFEPVGRAASSSGTASDIGVVSLSTDGSGSVKGLGLFAAGIVEALNRDVTTFTDGYDSTITGFNVGGDYSFSREVVVGLAFSYTDQDGDFDSGGSFDTRAYGPTIFAQYLPTQQSFIQIVGEYLRTDYDVKRAINLILPGPGGGPGPGLGAPAVTVTGDAASETNADVFGAAVLLGYDHPFGRWTVGPRLGLNWRNTGIDGYTESGSTGVELRVADQSFNSLQSVLGVFGSAAYSTGFGVLVPNLYADYIHEFANSQRFISAQLAEDLRGAGATTFRYQNDVPVRNFFNLGVGLVAVLPNGFQPYANFRAMVGNEQFNNYAGTFGVRVEM